MTLMAYHRFAVFDKSIFRITVVTFVNLSFFLCKSMQICCLVISANRTSACESPFANLFSPCKSLFGNQCVACKSVAFSDENRCNSNSKRIFSLFKCFYKKLSERLLYAIQLHVDLRDNHFKRTDRKHQQCLNVANDQALKLLCKRVPSNLYCLDIVKLRLCKRVFLKALLHI